MSVFEAMAALESLGFSFRLDENGDIKFRSYGEKTPETDALLSIARADRAAAAAYLLQRYSVFDAMAIGQAVKRGEAVLLSPVIYHREPVNVSIYWQPVQSTAEEVLQKHRQRLENALHRRLQEMEQETFEGWTDAEIDRFCDQYDRYKTILEVL